MKKMNYLKTIQILEKIVGMYKAKKKLLFSFVYVKCLLLILKQGGKWR